MKDFSKRASALVAAKEFPPVHSATTSKEESEMSIKEHNRAWAVVTALLLSITTFFAAPTQAALDNKGTEFFMAFMPNAPCCTTPDQVFVELHLTGDVATMVTVE